MKRFIFIAFISVSLLLCACSPGSTQTPFEDEVLQIHFIDVGQADSILILRGSNAMLIDGGNNSDADLIVEYLKNHSVNKINFVIGTHPHEDHIGGLDVIISKFEIGKVIMPDVKSNTKTFESLLTAVKNKGLKITTAKAGLKFDLDSKTKFEIFSPINKKYEDTNDYSAVIKLIYENTTFLFTGDAGSAAENEMIEEDEDLKADVLKVGHHGSKYSTTEDFLKAVSPEFAVISVGLNNSYEHPHEETLEKLKDIQVLRTDRDGTIVMASDGKRIQVKKEK